jgi:predicted nicotinamide N-methyase
MRAKALRTISGYPARLESVDLDVPEDAPLRRVELFTVDGLEQMVDTDALLRADDGVEPPYWALVWIGARAIAARIAAGRDCDAARTSVLDLGCGLGLSGLAAALRGAAVLFADYSDEALAFVAASLEHHGIGSCATARCDFTRDRLQERFDTILAADVVYDPHSYAGLVEFLDVHLAPAGTLMLTESLRADAQNVVAALRHRGFGDHKEALWVIEDGKPERTWLHTLRRTR